MDESRKAFEEWASSLGHNTSLDVRGLYVFSYTATAWISWQASRAAIEIKLPPKAESSPYEHYMPHYTMDADSVESAIRAAGIKVKE